MNDMNFFSIYKRSQTQHSAFKTFLIVFFIIVLLLNLAFFGVGYFAINRIESNIQSMKDYINNPQTKQAMDDAAKIKNEAELTTRYLELLQSVDAKLIQIDLIDSTLLKDITALTPEKVMYRSAQITGINVVLTCEALDPTAPMDMYHAFVNSSKFVNTVMSGIAISDTGTSFSISFAINQKEMN